MRKASIGVITITFGLVLASVLLIQQALANTIVVDGDIADWSGIPAVIVDGDDAGIPDAVDINQLFMTNNSTSLFTRFDTVFNGATTWANSTLTFNLQVSDTVNSAWRYYRFTATGTTPTISYRQCTANFAACTGPGTTSLLPNAGVALARNTTEPYNELSLPFATLGLAQPGITGVLSFTLQFGNTTTGTIDSVSATINLPTPTDVDLVAFTAIHAEQGVVINWETAAERSIAGFNLLRGPTNDRAEAVLLTPELIFGEGDALTGANYSFSDPDPIPGGHYWLQVVNNDGSTKEYGPVTPAAVTTSFHQFFMPLVRR